MSTNTLAAEPVVDAPQPRQADVGEQRVTGASRAFIEATLAEDWDNLHPAVFDDTTVATTQGR